MSDQQIEGQNHNLLFINTSFENVAKFTYLGKTVKKQKLLSRRNYEQIKFGESFLPLI